jgi:hypothetical protein
VPDAFYPRTADGTLRVLEYPPGAGTAEHTDFNLFTIVCWRSHESDLELLRAHDDGTTLEARRISPGLHIGELGELVGLGSATPHRVPARPYAQTSIVYFAMPSLDARLPASACKCVRTNWHGHAADCFADRPVSAWLADRIARSRVMY